MEQIIELLEFDFRDYDIVIDGDGSPWMYWSGRLSSAYSIENKRTYSHRFPGDYKASDGYLTPIQLETCSYGQFKLIYRKST
jgi:hypothetical protein